MVVHASRCSAGSVRTTANSHAHKVGKSHSCCKVFFTCLEQRTSAWLRLEWLMRSDEYARIFKNTHEFRYRNFRFQACVVRNKLKTSSRAGQVYSSCFRKRLSFTCVDPTFRCFLTEYIFCAFRSSQWQTPSPQDSRLLLATGSPPLPTTFTVSVNQTSLP